VIQAGARLVERVLAAMPVLGEPQADLQAVVPEKHLAACPVRRRELTRAAEAEHFPIPSRTRINVTNRQPEVMDAPDHGLLTVSLPRTASRRQVLRYTRCPGTGRLGAVIGHQPDHLIQRQQDTSGTRRTADHLRLAADECASWAR
jgi:hypothetical protein